MNGLSRGLGSTVGLKFVAGITGLFLLLFVLGHLLGNLQVYAGPDQLNGYAAKLQGLGPLLWVIRAGLLAILVLHLFAVLRLQLRNWDARPQRYTLKKPLKSTLASRTMIWTGATLFAFIVYHLLHFTVGVTDPGNFGHLDPLGRHDVYRMVVLGFQQAPVAIAYVVAMLLLGYHLLHGIQSIFQSLGWNHPKYRGIWTGLGRGLTVLIVIGNVSMPIAIYFGLIGLPGGN